MFYQDACRSAPDICVSERKYELSVGRRRTATAISFMPVIAPGELVGLGVLPHWSSQVNRFGYSCASTLQMAFRVGNSTRLP